MDNYDINSFRGKTDLEKDELLNRIQNAITKSESSEEISHLTAVANIGRRDLGLSIL